MASGRKIIVVGDKNSSGGTVISGAPQHTIGGRFIARLYDSVDCPGKYPDGSPRGVNPIIEGEERMPINGIPVALEGHRCHCGCTLIGSSNAKYGEDDSDSTGSNGRSPMGETALAANEQVAEQYYELMDANGLPVDGYKYDLFKYGTLHTRAAKFSDGKTASVERFALVDVVIWNNSDRFENHA